MTDIKDCHWIGYVKIICPECGAEQDAKEIFYKRDPWPTYIHDCEKCKHIIMESEWEHTNVQT